MWQIFVGLYEEIFELFSVFGFNSFERGKFIVVNVKGFEVRQLFEWAQVRDFVNVQVKIFQGSQALQTRKLGNIIVI